MAIDPRSTVHMPSPLPRHTRRLDRTHVMTALGQTLRSAPPTSLVARPSVAQPSVAQPPVAQPPVAQPQVAQAQVAPAQVAQSLLAPVARHQLAQRLPAAPLAAALRPTPMRVCSPTVDSRLMMLADPKSAQAAGFRLLRDTLATKGLPRVLAVSSPEAEDGKTTCAINLALAIAEHRTHKVLLIDANFAEPALAGILGIDESIDPAPERAWTAPFSLSALTPCLHVATIARRPGQSSSYVDLLTLARLFDCFHRAGYQQIILDTPSVESSPEAALLLHLAGGVLLAVRSGRSTTGALRRAVERIGPEKALGVTLMDAPGE